jgi:hypothetical protein
LIYRQYAPAKSNPIRPNLHTSSARLIEFLELLDTEHRSDVSDRARDGAANVLGA